MGAEQLLKFKEALPVVIGDFKLSVFQFVEYSDAL